MLRPALSQFMIKTNAQPDPPLQFPDWPEVLAASELDAAQQDATAITVRWYLSFCRRSRVAVCKQSARDFVVQVEREKRPTPGQLECWKEAIRWFFRAAPRPGTPATQAEPRAEEAAGGMDAGRGPVAVGAGEGWEERLRRVLRVRHYSYRTEQTYVESRITRGRGPDPPCRWC